MMHKSIFRVLLSTSLIGVASISLTAGIFPMFVSQFFGLNSFEVMLYVRSLVIPLALLWAAGGGIVGWQGKPYHGMIIMGSCGIISGLALSAFALGGGLLLVMASTLSGLIYGALGGLLLGKALQNTLSESH